MCIYPSFTRHQAYTVEISRERIPHWGRVTHICVSKLTIIGWDNGLSPGRRKAIIWTNDGILLIWSFGTIFSDILIEIHLFSFKKIHLNMSSAKCRPFCLGLNVIYHKHTHSFVLCGYDISSGFRWSIWPILHGFFTGAWVISYSDGIKLLQSKVNNTRNGSE